MRPSSWSLVIIPNKWWTQLGRKHGQPIVKSLFVLLCKSFHKSQTKWTVH